MSQDNQEKPKSHKETPQVTDMKEIVPAQVHAQVFNTPIEKAKFDPLAQTKSEMLSEEADAFGGSIVGPPINFPLWAGMLEINTRLNKAIQLRARNVAGLGWHLKPVKPINEDTPEEVKKKIEKDLKTVRDVLDCPNNDMPFTTLLYLYKLCNETTGNGYMEVVRNAFGKITEINHVPSINVRILKKNRGYVQMVGNKKVFYKKFGDTRVMDFKTGSFSRTPKKVPIEKRASELLHYKLHTSSRSTPYGIPRWTSTAKAITGNDLSSKRNVLFFENDAVPRMAVIVEGGVLSASSIKAIEDFLANAKGVENSGRVMVLQAELQKRLGAGGEKVNIRLEPLTVGMKEDASFQEYRTANDEEIRESFGIAEVYFKTGNTNKGAADVGRQTTNEQEFEPDRVELEFFLNHTLIRAILGKDSEEPLDIKFELERPTISNPVDRVRMDTLLSDAGVLSVNEVRERHGLPRFPDNFKFADMPMKVALNLLKEGLFTLMGDIDFEDSAKLTANSSAGRPTDPDNEGNAKSPRDNNTTTDKPVPTDAGGTSGGSKTPQPRKSLDFDPPNQLQLLKEQLANAQEEIDRLSRQNQLFRELEGGDEDLTENS